MLDFEDETPHLKMESGEESLFKCPAFVLFHKGAVIYIFGKKSNNISIYWQFQCVFIYIFRIDEPMGLSHFKAFIY